MSGVHEILHTFLERQGGFLLALLAGSIAVLALALWSLRFLHRASAVTRHRLLLATLMVPFAFAAASIAGFRASLPAAGEAAVTIAPGMEPDPGPQKGAASEAACVFAAIWLAGAGLCLARIAASIVRWRAAAKRSVPVSDSGVLLQFAAVERQFETNCDLVSSSEFGEPAAIGFLEPTVVLPAAPYALELDSDELRSVFAHELAHVVRRDNLTALAVQIVSAFFWFDPLHRSARRTTAQLREQACDELVLEGGCDREAYVSALAKSCQSTLIEPAIACMSRLHLEERMESIMTLKSQRRWPHWIVRSLLAIAIVTAALLFASVAPSPSLSAQESGDYDLDVRVAPQPRGGPITLTVKVFSPDGPFTTVAVIPSVPHSRRLTSAHGGRTYEVKVDVAGNGSASAVLSVSAEGKVVANLVKSFPVPIPPAPPRPDASAPRQAKPADNITIPKLLESVEPRYPEDAKRSGVEGVVILAVSVNSAGGVDAVRVVKPLSPALDQAAVDAVRQWRFSPATREGTPVDFEMNLTINFRL